LRHLLQFRDMKRARHAGESGKPSSPGSKTGDSKRIVMVHGSCRSRSNEIALRWCRPATPRHESCAFSRDPRRAAGSSTVTRRASTTKSKKPGHEVVEHRPPSTAARSWALSGRAWSDARKVPGTGCEFPCSSLEFALGLLVRSITSPTAGQAVQYAAQVIGVNSNTCTIGRRVCRASVLQHSSLWSCCNMQHRFGCTGRKTEQEATVIYRLHHS